MKHVYGVVFLIVLVSSLWIFYSSREPVSDVRLASIADRITQLENTIECLEQHNHKTYFYIAPHKIDSKSGIINDEVHEVYDDRIGNSNSALNTVN